MNHDKLTHKKNDALAASQELAMEAGHAHITPIHVAAVLISDPNDIFIQAVSNAGGVKAGNSAERVFNQVLKKLPSQSLLLITFPQADLW